jgi:hypothetical protein
MDFGGLILGIVSVSSYCPEPEREREREREGEQLTVRMGYFEGLGFLEAF